ncbi:hypothetical protein CDAR_497521 [Caerostris darwini]|uniref:Uncharacterized protein n=1 Tax=Caerostris darwini TaxID=1538125 RepID=A0AAV4S6F3_9ARAC|nr:hypothetical protein CDAR_497521 [Caerostris darwini]
MVTGVNRCVVRIHSETSLAEPRSLNFETHRVVFRAAPNLQRNKKEAFKRISKKGSEGDRRPQEFLFWERRRDEPCDPSGVSSSRSSPSARFHSRCLFKERKLPELFCAQSPGGHFSGEIKWAKQTPNNNSLNKKKKHEDLKSLTTTSGQERKSYLHDLAPSRQMRRVRVPVTSSVVPTLSCTARASMKADGRSALVANRQQSPMPLKKVSVPTL